MKLAASFVNISYEIKQLRNFLISELFMAAASPLATSREDAGSENVIQILAMWTDYGLYIWTQTQPQNSKSAKTYIKKKNKILEGAH